MTDNVVLPGTGSSVATDDIGGNQYQRVKVTLGADGVSDGDVSSTNPMPVAGAFFQATQPVSIAASVSVTGPLTDTQLRAVAVPVSGTVTATGPLTDTQLRATAVPVSGTLAVTGPLTDTQLRATPVPMSGTVTANAGTGTFAVSATSLPLPTGAATAAKQPALGTAGSPSADILTVQGATSMTALKVDGSAVTQPVSGAFFQATQPVSIATMPSTPVTGTFFQATQPVSIAASVAVTGPLTDTQLRATAVPVSGTVTATGPLTDTQLRATAVPVVINPMTALSYNVAGVIAINTTLISVDCSQVRTITMQCVSMGTTGAVTYQFSNDQVTWTNATYQTSTGTTASGTITAVGISFITVLARYFRVQLTTATTAGTTTFTGFSADRPANLPITTQSVTGTVTATATQPFTPTASLLSSAATTNATSVKATAGTIYAISASNVGAAAAFLKIFNLATAPTVGTSVPALTIPIPATGQISLEFGPLGLRFGTGISFSITNLIADADTTAIAAAQVKLIVSYV